MIVGASPVIRFCSPRTRGWSLLLYCGLRWEELLPAHAGMVRSAGTGRRRAPPAPRARGDGPQLGDLSDEALVCSPRTRGWSPPTCGPANTSQAAPRARGDGPRRRSGRRRAGYCSPRTRGWSHDERWHEKRGGLLPAHAGMVLSVSVSSGWTRSAPRARGDGPRTMTLRSVTGRCSPRTRGWSPAQQRAGRLADLLPAHAGMVPDPVRAATQPTPAPRARGDGPGSYALRVATFSCSPRTRGWSQIRLSASA